MTNVINLNQYKEALAEYYWHCPDCNYENINDDLACKICEYDGHCVPSWKKNKEEVLKRLSSRV